MASPSSNIPVPYLDLNVIGGGARLLLVSRRAASERLAHALTASLPHAPPVAVPQGVAASSSN